MSQAVIQVKKLESRGDYTVWKVRMLAHLETLGLKEALKIVEEEDGNKYLEIAKDEKLSANLSPVLEEKNKKARSIIILSVGDEVLRKIMKEETASGMLKAVEKLCMATCFLRRLYLKQKLHSFRINERQSISDNIDEFHCLIDELGNANVSISDEDQAVALLRSLPKQFHMVRDTLKYGRTSLTLDEVEGAVLVRELELGKAYRGYGSKCREKSKTRIGVEKFDGRSEYSLWKTKIFAHLEILDLMEALKIGEDVVLSSVLEEKKRKARSMIIENIEDQDLRKKIMKEDTVSGMFQVLDKLYMSISRRIELEQALYGFRMDESWSVETNIDDFQRLISELSNMKVSISDEEQALLLLKSLPKWFDHLRVVLTYGRTNRTLEEVIYAVLSKDLEL